MTARHHHSFWTYHSKVPRSPEAQLALDLPAVDRVAAIVPGTVFDELDEARGFTTPRRGAAGEPGTEAPVIPKGLVGHGAEGLHQLQVLTLDATTDVVDLPGPALLQDQVDAAAVVADVQPVADVAAIAIDGQCPPVQQVHDHQGDQLLREMEWTVVVGAVAGRDLEAIGMVVRSDQMIG